MAAAPKSTAAPLPAKLAGLLREARWLVLAAIAGYLALIFLTFRRGDPGWSHSGADAATHNAGGRAGAWIADLLLYLFGVSAYWWVALCLVGVAWGYRTLERSSLIDRRPLAIALGGFALLLVSSAALEALRLHSLVAELPLAPGGMLGATLGGFAAGLLGFTGATLALLTLAAVGFSLFTGVSWLAVAEATGTLLEGGAALARRAWEGRADRRAGVLAREEREHVVEVVGAGLQAGELVQELGGIAHGGSAGERAATSSGRRARLRR